MAGFNMYLNFYFMAHYFPYIQFNLLVNKFKSRQVVFTITIAIIFTIAGVKYVYVKTVRPIASVLPGFQFSTR